MPVAPGTSSCLAILVSAPTLMSLSVARSMRSIFSVAARRRCLWRAAGAGCAVLRLRLFASLSISFHSSSSPSPVTAETGSTESSNTDSSSLSARIRSPRASLSILVATTAAVRRPRLQPAPGRPSRSRGPGCRASTSSSTRRLRRDAARPSPELARRSTPRQLVELARRLRAAARVAVARQIHQVERRGRRRARPGRCSPAASCRARRSCAPRAAGPAR